LSAQAAEARQAAAEARTQASEARANLEALKREGEARKRRLAAIAEDAARWTARRNAAAGQIGELSRRHEELGQELAAAEAIPAGMAEKRNALLDAISLAEKARNDAGDAR